jgi:hypothetical protein
MQSRLPQPGPDLNGDAPFGRAGDLPALDRGRPPGRIGGAEDPMDAQDLLLRQLLDPFRWGLLVALVATMLRTEAVTGRWLPLAAGLAFVAAIIPVTVARPEGATLARAVGLGIVANLLILAALLLLREAWLRLRP